MGGRITSNAGGTQPEAAGTAVDPSEAEALFGRLEMCNSRLHEIGHRASGILFASRVFNAGEVSREVAASCELLRRIVAGSDELLAAVHASRSILLGTPPAKSGGDPGNAPPG